MPIPAWLAYAGVSAGIGALGKLFSGDEPEPYLSPAEMKAGRGAIDVSAKNYRKYKDYLYNSDMARGFADESVIQSEVSDPIFNQRATAVNRAATAATERIRGAEHTSGFGAGNFGVFGRMVGETAGEAAGEVAGARAEADVIGGQAILQNRQAMMAGLGQLAGLEGNVLQAQQAWARRLGEMSQYNKKYRNKSYYYGQSADAQAFYREHGMA